MGASSYECLKLLSYPSSHNAMTSEKLRFNGEIPPAIDGRENHHPHPEAPGKLLDSAVLQESLELLLLDDREA